MRKALLIAIIASSLSAMAQINIGITAFGTAPANDTVSAFSADTFNIWLKNFGPGTFSDVVTINTAVRDSTAPGILDSTSTVSTSATINPGDSVLLQLTSDYVISSPGYRYGINVIVIWPIASGAGTTDSLEFPVFIMDPNGINELDAEAFLRSYPNPSADNIYFENRDGIKIESIIIYDISGRVVLKNSGQSSISLESLSPGFYNADIILSDKAKYSIKIIKK
ncbi:MAG: hypothetical protein K0S44_2107 [Bacteroidetes bacterium]|jgi:hypothetical protein|nr:hypothetical protein [Bacteroidota bacterium]